MGCITFEALFRLTQRGLARLAFGLWMGHETASDYIRPIEKWDRAPAGSCERTPSPS